MRNVLRLSLSSLIALFALMPGLAILSTASPVEACTGNQCASGTGCYTEGKCLDGQRCIESEGKMKWADDGSCGTEG